MTEGQRRAESSLCIRNGRIVNNHIQIKQHIGRKDKLWPRREIGSETPGGGVVSLHTNGPDTPAPLVKARKDSGYIVSAGFRDQSLLLIDSPGL